MEDVVPAAANVSGSPSSATMSMPDNSKKAPIQRRYKKFSITNEMFAKLKPGLTEWRDVLSETIGEENEVLQFATENLDYTIVVENKDTKALRAVYPYQPKAKEPAPPVVSESVTPAPIPEKATEPPSGPISSVVTPKKWRFVINRDTNGKMCEVIAEEVAPV